MNKLNRLILFCMLLGLSHTIHAQDNAVNSKEMMSNDDRNRIDQIEELAKQIENEYISKLDFSERRKAINKMDELLRLVRQSGGYSGGNRDFGRWRTHTDDEITTLVTLVKKTFPFSDQKVLLYQDAAKFNYTINQTMMLMDAVSFNSEKTEVLRILYPKVKDKKNSYLLLSNTNYFAVRDEIVKIISGYEE